MKKNNKIKAEKIKKQQKEEGKGWQSIKKEGNGYIITINAKPNSKQTKVTQINEQFIGVSIAAPPRQGQANDELVNYISNIFNAKKSAVYVDKGGKSRNKMVIIEQLNISFQDFLQIIKRQI